MRLRQSIATTFQLSLLPAGAPPPPRRADALPDDGRSDSTQAQLQQPPQQQQQPPGSVARRVTAWVFANADWERDQGWAMRLWPPQRQALMGVYGALGRRSPTSSDAGTSYSEASESSSLRWAERACFVCVGGGALVQQVP